MSQIPLSNIAASVAQGALQQSQVARQRDARSNQGVRQAQRLRESAAERIDQVEDPFEASDEHVKVGDDSNGRNLYEQSEREDVAEEAREGEAADEVKRAYGGDSGETSSHIDVTG